MPVEPIHASLLTPPVLSLVRLRVPGFARLGESERLQAAALALQRDFGVTANGLLLATEVGESPDLARVAYCQSTAVGTSKAATSLLAAMQPGRVYWVGAPAGFVISAQGAISVDDGGGVPADAASMPLTQALPRAVQMSLTAAGDAAPQLVLVDPDREQVSAELADMWSAASGADVVVGQLPSAPPVTLRPVPVQRPLAPATSLDRSLRWVAVTALACAMLGGLRLALLPAPAQTSAALPATAADAQAGALFERILTVAPDLAPQLQAATYASGAWVLQLPAGSDEASLRRMARSLEVNGLGVQTTLQPAPRLRIQLAGWGR